ncbi:hypothetical protein G6K98_00025 [Agrobacterium rhizogenes]|nr:hypothetical protein [Rhizobium rhizogenes]NTH55885.1 hypothetical protein [Rhizobium rhizogenes]NTH87515.1 hypothetical protein [Rhizobium rhizogenes]
MQPFKPQPKKVKRPTNRRSSRLLAWIEALRQRQLRWERDRRRKWLLFLLLMLLDSKPAQMFFPSFDPDPAPTLPRTNRLRLKKRKKADDETGERPAFDANEHVFFDYSTRPGEHHLHVVDGLTYEDILELNRIHRPHLLKTPASIPGMPDRYKELPPHVWTLVEHLSSAYHRRDAITALKLVVSQEAHDWIDVCSASDDGWKELKRCRMKTPEMTIREFSRAAERWREEHHREAEEQKKEAKETPDNGPKPPGLD